MTSILNGLFAGRAGIASHGTAIAVLGDNIANANTIGFKTSRAQFQDLLAGGQASGRAVGAGSAVSGVSSNFSQGSLEFTGRVLDLAIDGNGFFVLADGAQRFYTRAGNFNVNSAGFIVNQNGLAVMGFAPGGAGALQPMNINSLAQQTVATTNVSIAGNLNASVPPTPIPASLDTIVAPGQGNGPAPQPNFADLSNAAAFSTAVDVFDSLGSPRTITYFFFRTNENEYTVRAYVNSSITENSGDGGLPREIGEVVLQFDGNGQLTTDAEDAVIEVQGLNWLGGAESTMNLDLSRFTQFSAPSSILSVNQNGQGVGTPAAIDIGSDGRIFALLDNGQAVIVGTLAMVSFSNAEGLKRAGNSLLQQSLESGEAILGTPGSGRLGAVQAGSLELSTVDIANEFVNLITLQRGFQANSRIITSINQLLSEVIQLA